MNYPAVAVSCAAPAQIARGLRRTSRPRPPHLTPSVAALPLCAAVLLFCQVSSLFAQSTLGDAVNAPQLTWTTGGSAGWVVETYRTHDGVAAASGSIEYYQQTSWIQTTVTGPGTLTFWWRCSTMYSLDNLKFYVNGVNDGYTFTYQDTWQQVTYHIGSGSSDLRWTFSLNSYADVPGEGGYLDQVVWVAETAPPAILAQPKGQIVPRGSNATFTVTATTNAPLTYQWYFNGTNLSGATASTYTKTNVQAANTGNYTVIVSNPYGSGQSQPAALLVSDAVYDNLSNFLGRYYPNAGATEYGDDVVLTPGPYRTATSFQFNYYSTSLVAGPGKNAIIRFYRNDGPSTPPDPPAPGTLLWQSAPVPLVSLSNSFRLETITNLFLTLPDALTWTVQFLGLATNENAGLTLYSPPVTGSSTTNFWKHDALNNWSYNYFGDGTPGSFGARITAISAPQPQLTALLTNSAFRLRLTGTAGLPYQIYASTNLASWTFFKTITNQTGTVELSDPASTTSPARSYRAVLTRPAF